MNHDPRGENIEAAEGSAHLQTANETAATTCWGRITDEEHLGGNETILLVEDEAFVREVTCEVLRSAGYEVLTTKNATEALRNYDQQRGEVDLLLTDVVLPGETGHMLAGKLRRQNPQLKVLLISGYPEQMGSCEMRCEECLAKPFSTQALLRKVRKLLDRRKFQTEKVDLVMRACGNE